MAQGSTREHIPLREQAYPDALKEQEELLLGRRCKDGPASGKRSAKIGLALSGGGIRSATFALGVIQALAARGEFKKIDVLSTVSGGGYTGSLISRLFTRDDVTKPEHVEQAIQPARPAAGAQDTADWIRSGRVLRWLRENGQHLAPNGSGDLLLAGAIILRNWLSVHVVLATLALTAFVFMQLVRSGLHVRSDNPAPATPACFAGADPNGSTWIAALEERLTCHLPFGELYLWWSPWLLLPLLILVVAVVPFGWAYWLAADYDRYKQNRPPWGFLIAVSLAVLLLFGETHEEGNPWAPLQVLILGVAVIPFVWASWNAETYGKSKAVSFLIYISFFLGMLSLLVGSALRLSDPVAAAIFTTGFITLATLAYVLVASRFRNEDGTLDDPQLRHWLSSKLKTALMAFLVGICLAVIDTLGQTIYAVWEDPEIPLGGWLAAWLSGLVGAAAGARQIATYFPGKAGATRIRPSFNIAAMIAAVLLFTVMLTALNAFSHGIAWGFKYPYHVPKKLVAQPAEATVMTWAQACGSHDSSCTDSLGRFLCKGCTELGDRKDSIGLTAEVFGFLAILSWFFGQTWPFLNNSTLLPLYTARLTRAYLGASNRNRIAPPLGKGGNRTKGLQGCPMPVAVTQVQEGDDMWLDGRWWPRDKQDGGQDKDPFEKGAPLHLVNVTINETLSGESRVQQNDRKGVGMAVGPAGISAGVRHHVVFQDQQSEKDKPAGEEKCSSNVSPGKQILDTFRNTFRPLFRVFTPTKGKSAGKGGRRARVFPDKQTLVTCKGTCTCCRPFRMFAYKSRCDEGDEQEVWYTGRSLTLGQWTGISGAAFSTGLGSRTSLGLSLIAGFFNVRLGLWWDSGVEPTRRHSTATKGPRRSERIFSWLLPVQSFLMDEFLSRFPGVARRWWYLSDGGHFENTGAYELIRRRLPLIVIVDAAADPDYVYEDLANLIRKARLDFGAEIEFLDDEGLHRMRSYTANPGFLAHFGSLEALRGGLSRAALGRVGYIDEPDRTSLIVYLKPTIVGGEPPDVTSYRATHSKFPQQTTADQFFDEAQWESYRKLGQFIAKRVFEDGLEPYNTLPNSWPSAPRD